MSFLAEPWVWASAAVVLAGLEMVLPGFLLLGFAVGAGGVAGLLALGASWMTGSVAVTLLVFAVISLVAWIAMRRIFAFKGASVKTFDHDIND